MPRIPFLNTYNSTPQTTVICPTDMTCKAWTTEPQRVWLEGRLATFREAQHAKKTTAVFFPQTQKAFKEMWPLEPPTDEELEKVGGSIEKAIADKNKALNSVGFQ